MIWSVVGGVVGGLLLVYAALLVLVWRVHRRNPETIQVRDAVRLLPDLARLLTRLATDRTLPAGVRVRVALLAAYLLSPIDLIPDFIPVIGYLDDAFAVAFVLRSVVRRAGPAAVERNWPGTPEGLALLMRLTFGGAGPSG